MNKQINISIDNIKRDNSLFMEEGESLEHLLKSVNEKIAHTRNILRTLEGERLNVYRAISKQKKFIEGVKRCSYCNCPLYHKEEIKQDEQGNFLCFKDYERLKK